MSTPNLADALEHSEELFDRESLQDAIKEIAVLINHDYEEKDRPVYLSVMHGGMLFASLLSLELDFDIEFDYLHATRYRGATTGSGLAWLHRPATSLEGRHVLIADDILDEGHTLKAIKQWCEDQGAVEVKIAVLAVKLHDRRVEDIEVDYIGVEVPDRYVYGFGMDYHEQGRNLPGLYALGN
jgi:hypoxanthine phosphoribosyltransferase